MKTHLVIISLSLGLCAGQSPAQDNRPPRRGGPPGERSQRPPAQKYSIEQAVSDKAQLHTVAFSGLAFITGDFGASTFIPPGKVCDFFGFQYMRDVDAAGKGHNPMFLNRVAGNELHILNEPQKQQFLDLAEAQAAQLEELARMRLPLIKSFHRQLDGQIPAGSDGLNQAVVTHQRQTEAAEARLVDPRDFAASSLNTKLAIEPIRL